MKREDLLKEMKESIGTKDPIIFFDKMIDVFNLLFDRIDVLEKYSHQIKTHSALSISWEPRVASDMLAKQIKILKEDKSIYSVEIDALSRAYVDDLVTQNYGSFCIFWFDTLGWHPFLDYNK